MTPLPPVFLGFQEMNPNKPYFSRNKGISLQWRNCHFKKRLNSCSNNHEDFDITKVFRGSHKLHGLSIKFFNFEKFFHYEKISIEK